MSPLTAQQRLVFPLDVATLSAAKKWITLLHNHVGVFKVGLELFTAAGPDAVRLVQDSGCDCFLDLKLHDIPATMQGAVRSAESLGAKYLTLHASAGQEALQACAKIATTTQLLAVTLLTSISQNADTTSKVVDMAQMAAQAGVHGIVSSPLECAALRKKLGPEIILVTPGIRMSSEAVHDDDQQRSATPEQAIAAGATLLVIGRPIRLAKDPKRVARNILDAIAKASP